MNLFVIIGGLGVVMYLVYMVTSEMFSNVSPSSIFKMCMKKIIANERVSCLNCLVRGTVSKRDRREVYCVAYKLSICSCVKIIE